MDVLCLLFDVLSGGINILDITQIALHKRDSAVILSKFNSLSNSPFVVGDVELVLAPRDNNDPFDAVEKQLCGDFYVEKEI